MATDGPGDLGQAPAPADEAGREKGLGDPWKGFRSFDPDTGPEQGQAPLLLCLPTGDLADRRDGALPRREGEGKPTINPEYTR